jgi:LCP family protein required for cell wall assembly
LTVAKIVAASLSVAVLLATGFGWATYRGAAAKITHFDAIPSGGNHAGKADTDGTDQNILIVGDDSRAGMTAAQLKELATQNDGGGVNTDTMMLVHVPADGSQASVVSLPRDLWVAVPGHGQHKLNSAYSIGSGAQTDQAARTAGFRLLVQTISGVTGLHIDHFVEVNLWGFYSISKAVGGIQVDLCHAVNDRYSGVDLPAGISTLEGTQALAFVRQRHGLPGGDLDRVRRQQYFIGALFRKVETAGVLLNPIKLTHLLNAVTSVLSTDPALDPIKLADQMRGLSAGNLKFTTIPITGEPTIDGQDVITYDPKAVQALFATLTHPKAAPAAEPKPTATVAPSAVSVQVRNASRHAGVATRTAKELAAHGFHASVGNNLPVQAATEIHYTSSNAAAARTLAKTVRGAELVVDADAGAGLQLDIGSTFTTLGQRASTSAGTSTGAPTASPTPGMRSAADRGCIN